MSPITFIACSPTCSEPAFQKRFQNYVEINSSEVPVLRLKEALHFRYGNDVHDYNYYRIGRSGAIPILLENTFIRHLRWIEQKDDIQVQPTMIKSQDHSTMVNLGTWIQVIPKEHHAHRQYFQIRFSPAWQNRNCKIGILPTILFVIRPAIFGLVWESSTAIFCCDILVWVVCDI